MTDRVQEFPAMLSAVLGDRLLKGARSFVDMLAEDAVMEFPFAPPGLPVRLEGRDGIADHLAKLARLVSFDRIGPATLVARDGDVAVLSFDATGRGLDAGEPYEQRYLSVVTTRDGRIARYVDYWDPLAVARALLGRAAVETFDLSGVYDG